MILEQIHNTFNILQLLIVILIGIIIYLLSVIRKLKRKEQPKIFTLQLDRRWLGKGDILQPDNMNGDTGKLVIKSRHPSYWWNVFKFWCNEKFGTDFDYSFNYYVDLVEDSTTKK